MKKSLLRWQFVGFVFASIAGVLLHFAFDLTDKNAFFALFSAVNESIWEHLKLLFFPMFVFALIESRYIGSENKSFWCVKLIGIMSGMALTVVLYYTINGVFGKTPDWINIAIFFIATAFGYILETRLLIKNSIECKFPMVPLTILVLIGVVFAVLTFITPQIPLFEDPITKTYGY